MPRFPSNIGFGCNCGKSLFSVKTMSSYSVAWLYIHQKQWLWSINCISHQFDKVIHTNKRKVFWALQHQVMHSENIWGFVSQPFLLISWYGIFFPGCSNSTGKPCLAWEGICFDLKKMIPRCCHMVFSVFSHADLSLCTDTVMTWKITFWLSGSIFRPGGTLLSWPRALVDAVPSLRWLLAWCCQTAFLPLLFMLHLGESPFSWSFMCGFHYCICCLCSFVPCSILWACFSFASGLFGCV